MQSHHLPFLFKFYPYFRKLRHPLNTNLFHPLKFYLFLITKILFMFLYRSGHALRKWVAFLFYFYSFYDIIFFIPFFGIYGISFLLFIKVFLFHSIKHFLGSIFIPPPPLCISLTNPKFNKRFYIFTCGDGGNLNLDTQ
jgi:hypothetical protein